MILKLTDGSQTIDLAGTSPVVACTYFPLEPTERSTRTPRARDDGENVSSLSYANVVEPVSIILEGTSSSILTWYHSVVAMLQAGRSGLSDVYVQYDPYSSDSVHRAKIITGRPSWPKAPLRRYLPSSGTTTVQVDFNWERDPVWEGDEVEARITATNQSAALGGVNVYNHVASGKGNWFQIASSQILGELPAPVRLEIVNSTGAPQFFRNFYFGNFPFISGSTLPSLFIQGEEARSGLGTIISLSSCSGGQYIQKILTGTGLLTWDLSSTVLQQTLGRRYKIFMRTPGYSGTAYITPQIRDVDGLTILWEGDEILLPNPQKELIDLGRAVPLPPSGSGSWAGSTFVLYIRTSGSSTVNVDYLAFLPTESYRHLVQRATEVDTDAYIVDDSIRNRAWWQSSADNLAYDVFRVDQSKLVVYPGLSNRIFTLHDDTTGSSTPADLVRIRLFYRPRRLVV